MIDNNKNETISIIEYINYDNEKRKDYVCKALNLKDNYLFGKVTDFHEDEFVIEDLYNPYTGKPIKQTVLKFGHDITQAIGKIEGYEDCDVFENQLVLFSFVLIEDDNTNLSKGRLLGTDPSLLTPLSHVEEIFNKLNVELEDLMKDKRYTNLYTSYLINELKEQQNKLIDEEEEFRKKKNELNILRKKLNILGFNIPGEEIINKHNNSEKLLEIPSNEAKLVSLIQDQLLNRGLIYNIDSLRQYYSALKTNQLVILSGPSGTGKTSLVKAFAEVTGGKSKIIPVQSSWTDRQDLLGFYNPMQKKYISTSFLDFIVEASRNENKEILYYICLDELNLATIEYYLADILSTREIENEPLQLYSQYEFEQNQNEVEWYFRKNTLNLDGKLEVETNEQLEYIHMSNNLERYPGYIKIPKNIRFIGTMNIDGTVRPLTPKVIDRSFVIHLDKQEQQKTDIVSEIGILKIKANTFYAHEHEVNIDDIKNDINRIIDENHLELKAAYNNRTEKHIATYVNATEKLSLTREQILDDIIAMKILPRIDVLIEDDVNKYSKVHEFINDYIGPDSFSYKKARNMFNHALKTKIYSYWS